MQTKNRNRALRRHHAARLSKARKNHYGGVYGKDEPHLHIGKLVTTACICSCFCCGNPRKWTGEVTLKELSDLEFSVKAE